MEKVNHLLFRLIIMLWSVEYLTRACDCISRGVRFDNHNTGRATLYIGLSLVVALCGWRTGGKSAEGHRRVSSFLWKRLSQSRPLLMPLEHIIACSSVISFLLLGSLSAYLLADNALHSLATLSDGLGQYELAERFYSINPQRDSNWSSSAVWRSSARLEGTEERCGRNAAVAKVYGARSLEMARRYRFLGSNLDLCGERNPAHIRSYYAMAAQIYHQHGLHGRCGEMWIERAFTEEDRNQAKMLRDLREAAGELARDQHVEMPWLPSLAEESARRAGDEQLARRFRLYDLKSQQLLEPNEGLTVRLFAYSVLALLALHIALGSRLGVGLIAELMIDRLHWEAKQSVLVVTSVDGRHDAYNRLIDLELHKGDLPSALISSGEQLRNLGLVVNKIEPLTRYSTLQRWLRIAEQQIWASALVCLFWLF